MSHRELELSEVQQEMLKNVLKIDEICKQLNLKYSLAYGSLIGAVRHDGFIPWDDDMDIWMSRKDLNIFVNYCRQHEELIKPYRICTRENTKNYPYGIPRFVNADFEYIDIDYNAPKVEMGIFVDIYLIEGCGNSRADAKKLVKKCNTLNILYATYVSSYGRSNIAKRVIRKGLHCILQLLYKDKAAFNSRLEHRYEFWLKPYEDLQCEYVGVVCWAEIVVIHKRDDVFDKNGRLKVIEHSFAGTRLNILENYDTILKNSYGDYMKLPPEEQRNPYHEYKIYKKD